MGIVRDIQTKFGLTKQPTSAATKLLWFAKPDGWTMFDKHAFDAIETRREKSRALDLVAFYAKLEASEFMHYAALVTKEGEANGVPLIGERVLDKHLMLMGSASIRGSHSAIGSD